VRLGNDFGGLNVNDSFGGIGLFDGTGGGGTERFLIGQNFQQDNWGVTVVGAGSANSTDGTQTLSANEFVTRLLLGVIDQGANTIKLYVDPNFSLTEAANAGNLKLTFNYGAVADTFQQVRLRGGNANNGNTWQFDNLNITQTSPFAAAAAIPEPSTILLWVVGLVGLGFFWNRQRVARAF
jgi:hypothetical protein